jgi:P-type E1-E2 ATPase
VAIDGPVAGVTVMADELRRPEASTIVQRLSQEGVRHVAMASGDPRSVADHAGGELGVDRATPSGHPRTSSCASCEPTAASPASRGRDGVNEAPALAVADLGIAMGVAGATVSSETADAVITVDRVDRVANAVHIGRRSLFLARQSVLVRMGLSFAVIAVAAAEFLPPVSGALSQVVVDLAVILNALRARCG